MNYANVMFLLFIDNKNSNFSFPLSMDNGGCVVE